MKVSRKLRTSFSNKGNFFFESALFIIILCYSGAFADDLPLIVIDPGHGGKDKGASGYYQSTEKQITLALANRIQKQMNDRYNVVLTREKDEYVPLFERTAIANNAQALAFISLHVGASFRLYPQGLRTFVWQSGQGENYYKNELKAGNEIIPEKRPLLWDHLQRYHLNDSKLLAKCVHNNVLSQINLFDRKIGEAPLLVLAGADMPAIVIEIAYISRPQSENNLSRIPYLDKIARGISLGIDLFFKKNSFDLKKSLQF
jgi:N-acetylmuramoyl-L-alanine amidase